jgi:hypothetical protein
VFKLNLDEIEDGMKYRFSGWLWLACLVAGSLTGFALGSAHFSREERNATNGLAASGPNVPRRIRSAASASANTPTADDGLQPFPPGFEHLSYDEICRKGPLSTRLVALLAWADHVSKADLAETTSRLLNTIRIGSAESEFTLDVLMARYGRTDPALAIEAMLRAGPSGFYGWSILLASITGSDPALAQQTAEKPALAGRFTDMSRMWTDFGIALGKVEDGGKTMDWALNLPPHQRMTVLAAMMQSGRFSSSEAAERLRPLLGSSELRSSLLQRWALDDPAAGAEWTKTLDAGNRWGLTYMWGKRDPKAALDWVTKNLPADQQGKEWPDLAASYVRRDPQAASQWVASLPEGEAKSSTVHSLLRAWRDDGALEWVRSLPESDTKGIGLLISSQIRRNSGHFEQALAIAAEAAPNAPERRERLQEAWEDWQAEDHSSAQRWLDETAALTSQEKASLKALNAPEKRSP